jgi:hypothetical protein
MSWREILNPTNPVPKGDKSHSEVQQKHLLSCFGTAFIEHPNQEFNEPSKSALGESPDKAGKTLTQEEAKAVRLLNLAGLRIIRNGQGLKIGVWQDLDGPELRAALRVAGLHVHPVVYLESAEAPIRYKVRHCPDRVPGESFERWLVRALSQARTVDD